MTTLMSPTSSSKYLAYPAQPGLTHHVAFTTVAAGNMSTTVLSEDQTATEVQGHRRAVEHELGIAPGATRFVSQIHSSRVVEADTVGWAEQKTLEEADAIVSSDGTDPLAILVADCLPVAFTTDYGPTAVAHAGRVGLLEGVLENTVAQLRGLNADERGTIRAVIGPSICGSCYEVPLEMRNTAAQRYPNIAAETSWGTPALDLPAAAEALLKALAVNVVRSNICTYTDERYYSHRREPGQGRIAGFVWKARHIA